ncbi:B-cell antigen receptor complex-associated protein alpha chain isoform X2 [Hemicordylus capensis]|uniref:B-cell antigen receptor complex-associated protein alpha chain isoform X2 n=1 Tax=Hemicordylus capensis TaxID=884348 RepID=UPI002302ADB8|nr:B-cell antigen receptor complex-associated protein alpha chain isoform X2 [Hemicordylus capensis]
MKSGSHQLYFLLLLGLFAGFFCTDLTTTGNEGFASIGQLMVSTASDTSNTSLTSGSVMTGSSAQKHYSGPATAASQGHLTKPAPLIVEAGPTSVIVGEAHSATLKCEFSPTTHADVTWKRCFFGNCAEFPGNDSRVTVNTTYGFSELTFDPTNINDTGVYYCSVRTATAFDSSCGTYLWVRTPRPTSMLNMRESIKNKIITAEGFLLLIFAIGPGLFLLFRRWENERLLEAKKKAYEEENLYEGLNLDDCSMYEDISRGLQATYQDIGNVKVIDLQLEKPEKP